MHKQLKTTAILGLLSIALFALAQVQVVRRGGDASGRTEAGVNPGGQAFASRADGPAQNPAIWRMRWSINTQLNISFLKAKVEGRRDVADRILQVSCWAVLAGMTPDQQRYEIDNVWQLGKWKPNDAWDNVAAAPSMVSELLKLSPEASREIQKILDESLARRIKDSDRLAEEIRKSAREKGLDFNRVYNEEARRITTERAVALAAKTGRSTRFDSYDEVLLFLTQVGPNHGANETKRVRALLTPAQNAEWTRIERTALEMARISMDGGDPFAPTKGR